MLPTPSTSHVSFDNIYEPAEDSYLLLDTLSGGPECVWLQAHFPPRSSAPLIVEVGSGSGLVIAFLAANAGTILGREDVLTFGVDVNVKACIATSQTVQKALIDQTSLASYASSICADLCAPFNPHSIDILLFNPPYVPTADTPNISQIVTSVDSYETDSQLLALSYAGGLDGMEITNRLLALLPHVLTARGVAYVLLCVQNKPEKFKERVGQDLGQHWNVETVGTSGNSAGWERLQIIKIWRDPRYRNSA